MNIHQIIPSLLLIAVALSCGSSYAQSSMRCGNALASLGQSKASVLEKCGEPVFKDSFCKPDDKQKASDATNETNVVIVKPCVNVDEWTYNHGSGQLSTTLRFESGQLIGITDGDRAK